MGFEIGFTDHAAGVVLLYLQEVNNQVQDG